MRCRVGIGTVWLVVMLLSGSWLASCGDDGNDPLTAPTPAVLAISPSVFTFPDTVSGTGAGVVVLLGASDGVVVAPGSPFRAGASAWNIAAGDLNRDGRTDIAAIDFDTNSLTLLLGQ